MSKPIMLTTNPIEYKRRGLISLRLVSTPSALAYYRGDFNEATMIDWEGAHINRRETWLATSIECSPNHYIR